MIYKINYLKYSELDDKKTKKKAIKRNRTGRHCILGIVNSEGLPYSMCKGLDEK